MLFLVPKEENSSLLRKLESQCRNTKQKSRVQVWPTEGSGNSIGEIFVQCLTSKSQFKGETIIILPLTCDIKDGFVSEISQQIEDSPDCVLCSRGCRIFPHHKVDSAISFWYGENVACYGDNSVARPVHVILDGIVVLPSWAIGCITEDQTSFLALGLWWGSYAISQISKTFISKVKLDQAQCDIPETYPSEWSVKGLADAFYKFLYEADWPKGVGQPFSVFSKAKVSCSSADLWDKGFVGFNMMSEPACQLDLSDAAFFYGAQVVRCGAVGDAKDLQYLINRQATSVREDTEHLAKTVGRLKEVLRKIDFLGLKVILTFSDLPGCHFYTKDDKKLAFWSSAAVRERVIEFWGTLVDHIVELKGCIAGYDLINEPFSEVDETVGDLDEPTMDGSDILNEFYQAAIKRIRKSDPDTIIILKPLHWGSPLSMFTLKPVEDCHVAYGIHMYGPTDITQTLELHPFRGYPCEIPEGKPFNKEIIKSAFSVVNKWRREFAVSSKRIICCEFGCVRYLPGFKDFLGDMKELFMQEGWSWLLFSFRDPEWHAMDYELGTDTENQLFRQPSDLLISLLKQ